MVTCKYKVQQLVDESKHIKDVVVKSVWNGQVDTSTYRYTAHIRIYDFDEIQRLIVTRSFSSSDENFETIEEDALVSYRESFSPESGETRAMRKTIETMDAWFEHCKTLVPPDDARTDEQVLAEHGAIPEEAPF